MSFSFGVPASTPNEFEDAADKAETDYLASTVTSNAAKKAIAEAVSAAIEIVKEGVLGSADTTHISAAVSGHVPDGKEATEDDRGYVSLHVSSAYVAVVVEEPAQPDATPDENAPAVPADETNPPF